MGGFLHRRTLRRYPRAWAVNSRYASSLMAAGLPYAIWEATTTRDELSASTRGEIRESGRGTGIGRALHERLLPVCERIEGQLYHRAAVLMAMSEYTRSLMIRTHRLPPWRVSVLPHPPAPRFLNALARAATQRGVPRSRERFRLLFVGRVDDPRKNFPLLLQSYIRARREGAPVSLTVAGPHTDRWRSSLGNIPADHEITILGHVDDDSLARAYLDHDALILTSKQEGFGIVVAEAFHAGLPVISTRCGGPEGVIAAADAGVLTGDSVQDLVRAIAAMATADARAMGARAGQYARRELSFDVFKERVRAATEAIVHSHPTEAVAG